MKYVIQQKQVGSVYQIFKSLYFYLQKSEMSKKPSKVQEDETTLKIMNCFRKKCELNCVQPHKILKDKIEEAVQNGKLQVLQVWGQLGPTVTRSFMDCLSDLNYQHLKKIRIWRANLQNEGLRSICNYIQKCNTIEYLDLMENNITDLGCQFLARVMMKQNNKIMKLRLDNNKIGLEGLSHLAKGLRQNDTLQKISLCYCNIPTEGAKYIQQMLANMGSQLRTLKLQGNPLMNEGFYEVIRAVRTCGDKLQKLDLADTGLNLLPTNNEVLDTLQEKISYQLEELVHTHKQIAKYNFRNNYISDAVAYKMLSKVKENKVIFIIEMPQCINYQCKQMHVQYMKKRKPKKKTKKGGKSAKTKKT